MPKLCSICGVKAYSDFCFRHKPQTPIKTRKPLPSPKKRINQRGKVAIKWNEVRKQWFIDHPEEHFVCYICKAYIPKDETTLDHVIPRSRAPHLRYEPSNLQPCCFLCNNLKGSVVL